MKKIPEEVIRFFQEQGFVIVSTIGKDGFPHSSCKGIIKISPSGKVYLLDVYLKNTHDNLRKNSKACVTAVEEHKFKGYCLKGKAKILESAKLSPGVVKAWEERIATRITQRLLKNLRDEKGQHRHPEALLPKPEYMIVMDVDEIVDLTPYHLRGEENA